MPVSPALAEDLAAAVAALYEQAELTLIERITRALTADLDSPLWAELKLAAIGDLRTAIEQIIAVLEVDASGAMHQALSEAYERGQQAAVAELGALATGQAAAAAQAVPTAATVDRLASALVSETGGTHARILRSSMDVYRQVIARASAAPLLGAQTRQQAAGRALQQFAERGVTGFVDRSGRAWNLTSYAEMATRSAVGRAAVEAHTDRLAAAGVDLVIVSDAPEECPRCKPWEGKVLARTGPSGAREVEAEHATEDDRKVTVKVAGTLEEARSSGLMHPNCRLPPHRLDLPAGRDEAAREEGPHPRDVRAVAGAAPSGAAGAGVEAARGSGGGRQAAEGREREGPRVSGADP